VRQPPTDTGEELIREMLEEDYRLSNALVFIHSRLRETEWRLDPVRNVSRRKICLGKIVPRDVWEIWEEYLAGLVLGGRGDVARWELEQNRSGCFFLVEAGPAYLATQHGPLPVAESSESIIRWVKPRRWDQRFLADIRNPLLRKQVRRIFRLIRRFLHPHATPSRSGLAGTRLSCLLSAMVSRGM